MVDTGPCGGRRVTLLTRHVRSRAVNYVVLRPEREVALRRALEPTDGGLKDRAAVLHMHEEFSSLGEFERHVVDSSDTSSEQTATIVAEVLNTGRFRLY